MVFYKHPTSINWTKEIHQKIISSRFARHSNLCDYLCYTQSQGTFQVQLFLDMAGVEERLYSVMMKSIDSGVSQICFSLSGY